MRRTRVLYFTLLGVAVVGVVLALVAVVSGGVSLSPAGFRISSRTAFRPLAFAVVAILMALRISPDAEHRIIRLRGFVRRHPAVIAASLSAAAFLLAVRVGHFEARAADQYGYVSQAMLWAEGSLAQIEPLVASAPWPNAGFTFAPLGYRPGLAAGTIVPTYPWGLPVVMAALYRLAGQAGIYLAVPLLAAAAVWITFQIGRRFAGPTCGLLSAALLLSSPIFLFQAAEPMSDVPVTAWVLLLVLGASSKTTRGTTRAALISGLAGSAAIATRPNLLPAVAAAGFFFLLGQYRVHRRVSLFVWFAVGILPGCLAVVWINQALYGSPLESGYGALDGIFSLRNVTANVQRYPRWLIESETPVVLLALAAPWWVTGAWPYLGTSLAVFLCYAFYLPFDNWTYLRFLLPAIPLLLILTSAVALEWARRRSSPVSRAVFASLFVLLLAWRWDTAVSHGVEPSTRHDRRSATMGAFVRYELPGNSIIVTVMHSGSVRYYGGRPTVRWDWLPPDWLDRALAFLESSGYQPYLLLEDAERDQFNERFGGTSPLAALDWPALATYGAISEVRIYDPDDRERWLRGEVVKPRRVSKR